MSSSSSSSGLPPASLAMAPPPPASASSSPPPPAPVPVHDPAQAQQLEQAQSQPQPSVAEPSAAAAAAAALPDPASTALPPPPVHPLPAHIGLPGKLEHVDSASSVVAEPPTPLPSAPLAATAPAGPVIAAEESTPLANGVNGANGHGEAGSGGATEGMTTESSESYNVEAERAVEHDHAHPGLGMYHASAPTAPGEHSSAVDVLADVAMGEAALGLADFASGAGSGDVKEGSPAVPVDAPAADSPSLKRSAPDEPADYVSAGGAADGTGDAGADRETKRLKVEPDTPAAVPSPVSALPTPVSNAPPTTATSPAAPTASSSLEVPAIPAPSLAAPSDSPRPSASPAPPVQGYDPSAFATAPTLASSAPAYPPPASASPAVPPVSTAPTMSPSDLHHFSGSPAPGSVGGQSASPMPPSALSSAPPPPPSGAGQAAEQQPVASTSAAAAAPALPANGAPADEVKAEGGEPKEGTSEPAPMPIITKEQQKYAINATRNLKRNKNAYPFLKPVDAVALGVPDYYRIITEPMDLGTVEARLQATGRGMAAALKAGKIYGLDYSEGKDPNALWEGQVSPDAPAEEPRSYRTINEFKHDLDLIWNNCFRYNGPREKNPVSGMAGIMADASEKAWRSMPVAPMISPYPQKFVPPPKPNPVDYSPRPVEARPKREIHAPAKDLPYLESAGHDVSAAAMYPGAPGYGPATSGGTGGGGAKKAKSAHKIAQEQLRFCKEVVKEMFKKVHEAYAYPFYQPVDLAAYPTYLQYVQKPMDLTTIRYKLEHNQYPMPPYQAFENDVRLIFHNCFAFNPPGTPVNDWGHRLEAVFNAKWSERPISFEESDDEDDVGLTAMEQQLHLLQQNIELMKANKKAQKEAKRLAHMQARMPMPMPMPMPPPKPAKKPSQTHVSAYSMSPYAMAAATAPPRKKSASSGARPSGGSQRKPKRRHDEDSDDYYEDDGGAYYGGGSASNSRRTNSGGHHHHRAAEPAMEEYVDFDMKRELAVKIVAFEGDQLEEAINIIRRSRPDLLGGANQEIELDIDQLDQRTLVALYRYVVPGSQIPVRPAPGGAGNGTGAAPKQPKQPKGGPRNQRKNLDEDKESERIEALEAQLRAFDQPVPEAGAGGGADHGGGGGGEGEAGGGDQASSDSSEDESSGSESDEM
ncbi:hypothetical protein JCM3774_003069 [Rhodotorula dairenensis]